MGTYSKGILGPFSGKVGTVVGSSWNGIDYMRSLPKPTNRTPTDAQLQQRVKMALAVGFLKPISPLLTQGFKRVAVNSTAFNVATSHFVKEVISGTYPDYTIDYPKVLISRGELTGPWNALAEPTMATEVRISWSNNAGSGNAKGTDKAVLMIYNPTKNQFVYLLDGPDRSQAATTLAMPEGFSGDEVHVYMGFISLDKKIVSTSVYAGSVLVA